MSSARREAGREVEEPLGVPDALAEQQQFLRLHLLPPHGAELAGVVVLLHREGGELADAERVEHCVQVLQVDEQAGLAEGREAVDHLGHAEDLGAEHVGAQVTAAAVAGGVGEALALHAARVVGRHLQLLDAHGELGTAVQRREARRAEPELGAESLARGRGLGERDDGPRVAETRAVRQQADLRQLHRAGDRRAHRDGVHAGAVAGVVGLHDRRQVAHAALGAEGPDTLVLGALSALPPGGGTPRAADDAAAAGGAALHVVTLERLAGDGGGALEPALAVVARGQCACLVEHVDEHRGAELGQRRGSDRVRLDQLLGLVDDELEPLRVGDGRLVRHRGRPGPAP